MAFKTFLDEGPPSPIIVFTPFLVGTFLSTILYGVICTQVVTYFQTYGRRDVWWLKLLVAYLFLAETFMTLAEFAICYEPFVFRSGSTMAMAVSPVMLPADAIGTVLISTPVQLYLAWRLKLVTGSNILAAIIVLFSLAALVGGLLTGYNVIRTPEFHTFGGFSYAPTLWLICAAVCDVLISAGLVWFLLRNKTGFARTKSLVDKIVISTIQSGIMTSVVAIVTVAIFLGIPNTLFMFLFDFSLSKLYASSLLSTLNARKHWNDLINRPVHSTTTQDNAFSLASFEAHGRPAAGRLSYKPDSSSRSHTIPRVEISKSVERSTSESGYIPSTKSGWGAPGDTSPTNTSFNHLNSLEQGATVRVDVPVPKMINGRYAGVE